MIELFPIQSSPVYLLPSRKEQTHRTNFWSEIAQPLDMEPVSVDKSIIHSLPVFHKEKKMLTYSERDLPLSLIQGVFFVLYYYGVFRMFSDFSLLVEKLYIGTILILIAIAQQVVSPGCPPRRDLTAGIRENPLARTYATLVSFSRQFYHEKPARDYLTSKLCIYSEASMIKNRVLNISCHPLFQGIQYLPAYILYHWLGKYYFAVYFLCLF